MSGGSASREYLVWTPRRTLPKGWMTAYRDRGTTGGAFVWPNERHWPTRLYRDQIEGDGTLMLSRDNARWLFEMAAVGMEQRREPVAGMAGGRETIGLAIAPVPNGLHY